ncbi:MAG: pyridoxamine 5'-phosphate oxidase family protein [Micromonosporaceae bacterium]
MESDGAVLRDLDRDEALALLAAALSGTAVAFEADEVDADHRVGWSVIVVGRATVVTDPDHEHRLARLLHPWVEMPNGNTRVIRIRPELVTGRMLVREGQ